MSSTQLDRLTAVFHVIVYLGGFFWLLLNPEVHDRVLGYYVGVGTVIVIPVVVYLLSRVFSFKGVAEKLEAIQSTASNTIDLTRTIEAQTNGQLKARLDSQTDAIVSRVVEELRGTRYVESEVAK